MENKKQATKRWYIAQTFSGHEHAVKQDLETRVSSMGMQDYIFRILIPEKVWAIYPYFYSAWPELKRISWPRRKEYIDAAIRTFIFTVLLTLVLLLFDLLIVRTIGKIAG